MGILALLFCLCIIGACAMIGLMLYGDGGAAIGTLVGIFIIGLVALGLQWRAEG